MSMPALRTDLLHAAGDHLWCDHLSVQRYVIWLILALTHYFIGWWLGGTANVRWQAVIWPTPTFLPLPYHINFTTMDNIGDKTPPA